MAITKIADVIVPELFNRYVINRTMAVSYTHLDVYKRQLINNEEQAGRKIKQAEGECV